MVDEPKPAPRASRDLRETVDVMRLLPLSFWNYPSLRPSGLTLHSIDPRRRQAAPAFAGWQEGKSCPGSGRKRAGGPCNAELFSGPLVLDRVPDPGRDIRAAEPGDGADAGRRGDVDLGEVAVDDVDADEQQSALAQAWPQRRADFALAVRKLGGLRRAPAHHVGAQI